jgi:hypothetical protein
MKRGTDKFAIKRLKVKDIAGKEQDETVSPSNEQAIKVQAKKKARRQTRKESCCGLNHR